MRNKMVKLEEKEDWISNLPDHVIHHILSFLPSTKQAIRTSVLSKRWRNQWTGVPVLIIDSDGMSYENFIAFVDNTLILYDCSKIKKIHLRYNFPDAKDPEFTSKFLFTTRTNNQEYIFPEFVFNNASLVKLTTINCTFMPHGNVNWGCLTSLRISHGKSIDQAMEYILSGSPLLKSLKLRNCLKLKKLVITSIYLEILDLRHLRRIFYLEVSCPKLKILKLISCSNVKTVKLLNLSSSLYGTVDFYHFNWEKWTDESFKEIHRSLVKDILQQLHHIKELRIFWNCFFEIMSTIDMKTWICPMLNVKCLTLHCSLSPNKHCGVLAWLLRNSPRLKKLVIDLRYYQDNHDCGENYWNSNTVVYDCLSHLKTVRIICSRRKDDNYKLMLNFLQFLLKNARVLKSMVVEIKDDETKNSETAFPLEVSQELLSLPRCSQRATIQLIYSK